MVDSRVEAVALSADGTSMLNIALNDNGVLRARSELGFPDFVTVAGASHPASRTAPIAFYSSAAGGVFMLGGSNPASGLPLHDMWARQMNDDWRPVVAAGYAPDTVLAATYSFADHFLYVLEHTISVGDTVRLARVDPRSGDAQTLATCARGSTYPTSYLTLDDDGSVVVTSASGSASIVGHLAVDGNGAGYARR